jgi:hypothetical protein
MWKLSKFIVTILSVLGIYSYAISWGGFLDFHHLKSFSSKLFLCGFVGGFLFWLVFGRFLQFFQTFEHEMTHLLVGLVFLKKPKAFFASEDEGGMVNLYGSNFLVTLAPYFLPILSLLALPFFHVVKPAFHNHLYVTLGFLTGHHVLSTFQEFRFGQPDIRISGLPFSFFFCFLANLVILGCLFSFVQGGLPTCWSFLKGGYQIGVSTISLLVHDIEEIAR